MNVTILKSKIHRATVTEANLYYEGSITIDKSLMEAACFVHYEQVHIFNLTNGLISDNSSPEGLKISTFCHDPERFTETCFTLLS